LAAGLAEGQLDEPSHFSISATDVDCSLPTSFALSPEMVEVKALEGSFQSHNRQRNEEVGSRWLQRFLAATEPAEKSLRSEPTIFDRF
jgi:hypothetical protein